MKKLISLLFVLLLTAPALAQTVEKISDSEIKITTAQVEVVPIARVMELRTQIIKAKETLETNYTRQKAELNARLIEVDKVIADAKALGVEAKVKEELIP